MKSDYYGHYWERKQDVMNTKKLKPITNKLLVHVYVNGNPVLENGSYVGGTAGEVVLKTR